MSVRPVMVGLGELLWDLLPSKNILGGAPANFAYMANVLGNVGIVASRVGNDELGWKACHVVEERGMESSYLQHDKLHETGTARVLLEPGGQPKFTIRESVAWDFLEWTPAWQELSARADVVCFGPLAQRSPTSAETIERFLLNTPAKTLRICDANLRKPFYAADMLRKSFQFADVLKLNDEELLRVSSLLGIGDEGEEEELAATLLREFDLELICVTKGARGSLLVSKTRAVRHTGLSVEVADAIGAGDAFTACVAHYYVQSRPLEQISESANRFAAWVTTQVWAAPFISPDQLEEILNIDGPGSTKANA
jgi:fructokinase